MLQAGMQSVKAACAENSSQDIEPKATAHRKLGLHYIRLFKIEASQPQPQR